MADVYKFDRAYGVSALLFDSSVPAFSPVFGDVERKVEFDEDGKEIVSFVPVDYKKINDERGTVDNWSLDSLLKAGINPNFGIHTGSSVSRIEGFDVIENASKDVDVLLNSSEEVK